MYDTFYCIILIVFIILHIQEKKILKLTAQDMKTQNLFSYLFLLIFFNFCAVSSPFSTRMSLIDQNLQTAWNDLEKHDQEKINQSRKLLSLLKNIPEIKPQQTDTLNLLLQDLEKKRLNKTKMAVSENIDAYDLATEKLLNHIKSVFDRLPQEKRNAEIDSIWSQVQKIDEGDLLRRIRYDGYAEEMNQILRNQGDSLRFAKKKHRKLSPISKFALKN